MSVLIVLLSRNEALIAQTQVFLFLLFFSLLPAKSVDIITNIFHHKILFVEYKCNNGPNYYFHLNGVFYLFIFLSNFSDFLYLKKCSNSK